MSAVRSRLSRTAARLLCERYGVQPKANIADDPTDERFGRPFEWGTPAEALPIDPDQAAAHSHELAAELAAFDHYNSPQEKR